jgi:DNA invertase Pin-like site-specific DNA recombinase
MNYQIKYFLYARKSTDQEDMQVQSIEAQLVELRNYAKDNHLNIIEEFIEKQTAKVPGRPIFKDMLDRMEQGEASGIISWNPDRLSQNSISSGRIIYLIDTGIIKSLKFPTFWFEPTPQGILMLNMSFGQSKYSRKTNKNTVVSGVYLWYVFGSEFTYERHFKISCRT